jgi:hypothetical protein
MVSNILLTDGLDHYLFWEGGITRCLSERFAFVSKKSSGPSRNFCGKSG